MRSNGLIVGALGLLLILAGVLGVGLQGNIWNDFIFGGLVALLGFRMAVQAPVQGIISGILGLWLIISAFVPGLQAGDSAWWDDIIVGILLAFTGFSTRQNLPETTSESAAEDIRRAA